MKKWSICLLSFLLVLVFSCPVLASEQVLFDQYVVDAADVFSEEQETQLHEDAERLTEAYGCAVYLVTIPELEGYEAWEYNQVLHEELGLGYGSQQSCVILLVSMGDREYDIMAHGYGNAVFTDYGKEQMAERFIDEFAADDWLGGYKEYLICCEEYLELAAAGTPFDVSKEKSPVLGFLLGLGIPSAVAAAVCSVFKGQMKTANLQTEAQDYIKGNGLVVTKHSDVYTHSTRSQRKIENDSEEKSGTSVNENGSSHKSGKF